MDPFDTTTLMHAVLDGEAGPDEKRELERRLACDPAARAEFDGLSRLFVALAEVPRRHPPEGLVAAVTAAVPQGKARPDEGRQLFPRSRVLAYMSSRNWGSNPRDAATPQPARRHESPTRSYDVSKQSNGIFSSRKTWIGAAIAAAAVVVVGQYGFGTDPRSEDVSGTIAPAQRYRAQQATAADIKLGGGTAAPAATSGNPAAQGDAANNAAANSAQNAAANSAQNAAANSAQNAAANSAQNAAANSAQNAAANSAQNAAANSAQNAAANSAQNAAANSAQNAAANSAQNAAANSAQNAAANSAQNAAANSAKNAAANSAQNAAANAAKNAAQNAAK